MQSDQWLAGYTASLNPVMEPGNYDLLGMIDPFSNTLERHQSSIAQFDPDMTIFGTVRTPGLMEPMQPQNTFDPQWCQPLQGRDDLFQMQLHQMEDKFKKLSDKYDGMFHHMQDEKELQLRDARVQVECANAETERIKQIILEKNLELKQAKDRADQVDLQNRDLLDHLYRLERGQDDATGKTPQSTATNVPTKPDKAPPPLSQLKNSPLLDGVGRGRHLQTRMKPVASDQFEDFYQDDSDSEISDYEKTHSNPRQKNELKGMENVMKILEERQKMHPPVNRNKYLHDMAGRSNGDRQDGFPGQSHMDFQKRKSNDDFWEGPSKGYHYQTHNVFGQPDSSTPYNKDRYDPGVYQHRLDGGAGRSGYDDGQYTDVRQFNNYQYQNKRSSDGYSQERYGGRYGNSSNFPSRDYRKPPYVEKEQWAYPQDLNNQQRKIPEHCQREQWRNPPQTYNPQNQPRRNSSFDHQNEHLHPEKQEFHYRQNTNPFQSRGSQQTLHERQNLHGEHANYNQDQNTRTDRQRPNQNFLDQDGSNLDCANTEEQCRNGANAPNRTRYSSGHTSDKHNKPKLATFDGKEDWESFIVPLERIARRFGWSEEDTLDQVFTNLRGAASKFACKLPLDIRESYPLLRAQLQKRFGIKEPPTTARRRLSTYKQDTESNEVFSEEIRQLVTLAYPDATREMQDEYAADAFLCGYKNGEIAYHVMNSLPKTLAEAQERVKAAEYNYRAAMGKKPKSARRVSFETDAEEDQDPVPSVQRVKAPSAADYSGDFKKLHEEMQRMWKCIYQRTSSSQNTSPIRGRTLDRSPKSSPSSSPNKDKTLERTRSPSPNRNGSCHLCGEFGHWARECVKRENSKGITPTAESRPNKEE